MIPSLTNKERRILALLAETGASNMGLAGHLDMHYYTLTNHLRAIYEKLGLCNRTEAATWWLRHGKEL